jgi:hypothetical protein
MMVCWLTLQILAASPVVKTVFMGTSTPAGAQPANETGPQILSSTRRRRTEIFLDLPFSESDSKSGFARATYRKHLKRINPEIRRFRPCRRDLPTLPMMLIITTLRIVSMRLWGRWLAQVRNYQGVGNSPKTIFSKCESLAAYG